MRPAMLSENTNAIPIICKRFPNGLTDLEFGFRMLLLNLAGRNAFEYIEAKGKMDIVKAYRALRVVKDVMDRAYIPNGYGSEHYFKDMKKSIQR